MSKQRIEDLGRLSEKLNILIDDELFDWKEKITPNCRDKDVSLYFFQLDHEKQSDIIHSLAYQISDLHTELYNMFQIARWGDEENGQENESR